MSMDRRTFFKYAASIGVVLTEPTFLARAMADTPRFSGPFLVTVHASGGWDPTLLCDPKGRANELEDDPVNRYMTGDIDEVGPFQVAPLDGHREFFERYRSELLVVNGIDTGTNSHDTGTRHIWSGAMTSEMPSIGALAAASAPSRPALAFLSNGGYDATGDIVAATRLPSIGALDDIAYPHRLDPSVPSSTIFTDAGLAAIDQARADRLARQMAHPALPRQMRTMELLAASRLGDNEISQLVDFLPTQLDNTDNPLRRQAQVAMASFKAGLSISANLTLGGYDTHGNHDQNHEPRMRQLVQGLTFIMEEAERQGVASQIVLAVGSDFARTPWYNETNGKDHWSITSMMFMGPGIRGGRVVGATDARQSPLTVNPTSLALDEAGVRITPGHVHHALRQVLQIESDPRIAPFTLTGDPLPLFG